MDAIRYEVRDSGHFASGRTGRAGAVVLDLTLLDEDRVSETISALGTDGAQSVHVVVPAARPGRLPRPLGGVRMHTSVAAALSAARARHSPVSGR